ncbi:glycosyltransferase family 4 protein [Aliiglaciecola sp. SL4]|uniref:glycosyltransferase family 4 protein n=1 Tax=Aliiglaciecola sp. SL4 TaxID=3239806 RepID=UPI00355BF71D
MIFLVDLPKPVHGMSNVNLAMLNYAKKQNLAPKVINTVPSYAAHIFPSRGWKVVKSLHTIYCLIELFIILTFSKKRSIYRAINGGAGKYFDILYLKLGKLFNCKFYIHHHSFNYLNDFDESFEKLNKLIGKDARHFVLGQKMADLLSKLYNISPNQISIVSNLTFFQKESIQNKQLEANKRLVIGHLANLCAEKGIKEFINICEELTHRNVDFIAKIAGPFADELSQVIVNSACEKYNNISYLGPLYEESKVKFYQSLDCFIFPSHYKNEAEPLVLYEAAASGAFIMGSERGCMRDSISKLQGYSCSENENLVCKFSDEIVKRMKESGFSLSIKHDRKLTFEQLQVKAESNLVNIFQELTKI